MGKLKTYRCKRCGKSIVEFGKFRSGKIDICTDCLKKELGKL